METSAASSTTPDLLLSSSTSETLFTANLFIKEQMTKFQQHFVEGCKISTEWLKIHHSYTLPQIAMVGNRPLLFHYGTLCLYHYIGSMQIYHCPTISTDHIPSTVSPVTSSTSPLARPSAVSLVISSVSPLVTPSTVLAFDFSASRLATPLAVSLAPP